MVSFFLFAIAPIDPVTFRVGLSDISESERSLIEREWGLDKPLWERYWNWAYPMFSQLDFGNSWRTRQPVIEQFLPFVGNTLILFGTAFIISLVLATNLGIIAAKNHNKLVDRIILQSTLFGFSIPGLVLAIVLSRLTFSLTGILPQYSIVSEATFVNNIATFIVAEITMIISNGAFITRLVRSQLLRILNENYIKTARAKGLPEQLVIYKHALRNALLPYIISIALALPAVLSGSVIIEQVFNFPGIGLKLIEAAINFDLPVVLAASMFFATLTLFILVLAQTLLGIVDPRISANWR